MDQEKLKGRTMCTKGTTTKTKKMGKCNHPVRKVSSSGLHQGKSSSVNEIKLQQGGIKHLGLEGWIGKPVMRRSGEKCMEDEKKPTSQDKTKCKLI